MNRKELRRYVGITGFSLGQVEKDYLQHIVLGALSRRLGGILVFKGGTALQKTGLLKRFSEDLDFTLVGDVSLDSLRDAVTGALETYNFAADVDNLVDDERTLGFRLTIQGPLFRDRRSICTIRIEASRREEVSLPPRSTEIDPPYYDILPYVVEVMNLEEIAAEKIRAIYTRDRARDLYDLYRLTANGVRLREDLASEKLRFYDTKFDKGEFLRRCADVSKRWREELESLLESVPSADEVLKTVADAI
ncbi:MAG: nucleotidyl transferase AbiEii/AbiGii toxin family protein [Thermoplasmata archaeon]